MKILQGKIVGMLAVLTTIITFLFTGCGSNPWHFTPNLLVSADKEEIFVGETAKIEITLDVLTELDEYTDLTDKQQDQLDTEKQEYLEQIREEYMISYTIPEEFREILDWDEDGVTVKGLAPGTAEIHVNAAKSENTEDSSPDPVSVIYITVKEILPEAITLSENELTLTEEDEKQITAEVTPEEAANKEVEYKSSDEEVVTVDTEGNIKAVKAGEAEITVTAKADNSVMATVKITVEEKVVETLASGGSGNSGAGSSGSSGSSKNSNSGSAGSSGKSGSGKSGGSSGNSGSGSSGSSNGGSQKSEYQGGGGGEIGGQWYDTKDKYDQGLKDLDKWEKDNGIITE